MREGMKSANIAEVRTHLSRFLALAEKGEEIEIRRRNVPVARIVPLKPRPRNQTKLGCGAGTGKINCDLTEPVFGDIECELPESRPDGR
jgi:prevent-host-death family protein